MLKTHRLVVVGVCLLFCLSLVAALHLPLDALPDVVSLEMEVNTTVDAIPAEDVEKQVTVPLERALNGLPGLEMMRSSSQFGLSQIELIFQNDTSILTARQAINERLQKVKDALPPDTQPVLSPVKSGLGEILYYSLDYKNTSIRHSWPREQQLISLKRYEDVFLGPQIQSLKGVAEVSASGAFSPQVDIDVNPWRLAQKGLSWNELADGLRRNARSFSGGVVQFGRTREAIAPNLQLSIHQARGQNIISRTGQTVPLKDVADVRMATQTRIGAALENGQEGVISAVVMQRGENTRDVSKRVTEFIERAEGSLPFGMELRILYSRGELIGATIGTITRNLGLGAIIVALTLFLFLRTWVPALVVLLVIPISFITALGGLSLSSYSGNLISLGAIDFGLIVDGAVVIAENVVRRLANTTRGRQVKLTPSEKDKIINEATREVAKPVVLGVCAFALVYVPIFALGGVEGRMFKPLATMLVIALGSSLMTALVLVPLLLKAWVRDTQKNGKSFEGLESRYLQILAMGFRFKGPLLTAAVILVISASALSCSLGGDLIPKLNEGTVLMPVERSPSIDLDESIRMQAITESTILNNFPEVAHTFSRVGTDDQAVDAVGVNEADTYLILRPETTWTKNITKEKLLNAINHRLSEVVPNQSISFTQPVEDRFNDFIQGARSDLAIKVFGDDVSMLDKLGLEIKSIAKKVPGVKDVNFDFSDPAPVLRLIPNEFALDSYGLSVFDLNQQIVQPLAGVEVGSLREGDYLIDEVVRLPIELRSSINAIGNLPLQLSNKALIPMKRVASMREDQQPVEIDHEDGRRRIAITLNVRGRDLASCVEDIQREVQKALTLPEGYSIKYDGHFKVFIEARNRLLFSVPFLLAFVFTLIFLSCRSILDSFTVMTALPFALVGGVAALLLRGLPLSIPAIIGFIALSGIAALNGIVLVSCIYQHTSALGRTAAILEGCRLRLRPVLMTASVGSLGFLPMAIAQGPGSEIQRPLATVVIGGIISSTLLTLFIVPTILKSFRISPSGVVSTPVNASGRW